MFKYDENKIQEGLRIISQIEPSSESTSRAVDKVRRTLTGETNKDSNNRMWRITMRSPITKLAMAAVVIIAAGLAIHYFAGEGTQKCCAWERIADKVAQIKTCVYREHTRQSGEAIGQNGHQFEAKIYISSDYGYKSETTIDGNLVFQSYMNPGKKVMVVLMPLEKKYTRILLTDEMLGQMEKEMQDPREMVTKFMSGPYKELGKDTINGVEVKGIEVNNPPAVQNFYNNFIGRMWVDVATEYPVRMEIEAEIGTGAQKVNVVIVKDDFEWGTELSADIFKPDIPVDFTLKAETKMPAQDETSAIDGLKYFSELTKGRYPSSMNSESVTQESSKALSQSYQQSMEQALIKDMNLTPGVSLSEAIQQSVAESLIKDMNLTPGMSLSEVIQQSIAKDMNLAPGVKPSEAMQKELVDKVKKKGEALQQEIMTRTKKLTDEMPIKIKQINEAMQQELMNKATKLQGPALFYSKLVQDGKEPVYHGDKVTAEFGDSVLMRWKIAENQYRVIFGNLTVNTVSADELAELEAMPLNRQPKAIKPKPADGTICRQIADLELSWMPGMYAATNKVYMGTAPDGLALLADVSSDSNLIVQELHQKTYYWRVDGIDANGKVTTGDVWSFNTGKLVGWWKFDESTGTIASDSSGNGNNGALKGNPVWKPQGGKTGGAIELGGKGDYVEISNESAFDITGQITVSAWVNITDVPQEWTGIVTKGDSAWRLSTSFAKNIFHFGVSSRDYINGTTTVDSGQWHNVVCVYDGQKMSIYVDGKPDVISMPLTVPIGTNNFPVCIGENIELKGRCFHGLIDDVRIYDYALSENEVVELYNGLH
jgi:outer membrane lipoprotein-sorting protein